MYIPGSTASINQRALLPPFGGIFQYSMDVNSLYNAFELSVQKRFSHAFSILANYTRGKVLDDLPFGGLVREGTGGNISPIPWYLPGRHQFDHGPSDFDRAHIMSISYVWQLPKLAKSNVVARRLLGDWELTGIMSAQSGSPVNITAAGGPSQTGLGNERGVLVGQPYGTGACGTSAPCVDYLVPASFQPPPIGTFGTLGKGALRGPSPFGWDMGLFKVIPLKDRLRLQVRGEFFNLLNRPNFNNPTAAVGGAGFGSINSAQDPRISQLALKLLF